MSTKAVVPMDIGGQLYPLPVEVADHIEELERAWESEAAKVNYLACEMRWFCGRVERGEIQSKRTYESFKKALATVGKAHGPIPVLQDSEEALAAENRAAVLGFFTGLVLGAVGVLLLAGILG